MLSSVDALAVLGVDAYVVRVEVDVSSNFQAFSVVGLPDAAVRESGERVKPPAQQIAGAVNHWSRAHRGDGVLKPTGDDEGVQTGGPRGINGCGGV